MMGSFEQIQTAHQEKVEECKKLEDLLQTLSTGMAAQEGHENGYNEQLLG